MSEQPLGVKLEHAEAIDMRNFTWIVDRCWERDPRFGLQRVSNWETTVLLHTMNVFGNVRLADLEDESDADY